MQLVVHRPNFSVGWDSVLVMRTQGCAVPGIRGKCLRPCLITALSTTNWIYQILRYVISASIPLGEFWFYCFPNKKLRIGYWALSIRIKIYCWVPCGPQIQEGAHSSPRAPKFHNTFEALACTWFSHSPSVRYSHCLSKHWFQVTLLIISVQTLWSSLSACDD